MLIDANTLPVGHRLDSDVVVVGGGPAGLALAMRLGRSNRRVLVLESGGASRDKTIDRLNEGASADPVKHAPPSLYRTRALGGASTIWGGRCVPLDPLDFEQRPWVPNSGWPIGERETAPYLDAAMTLLEAGEPNFEEPPGVPFIEGYEPRSVDVRLERFSPPTNVGRRYRSELEASRDITVVTHAVCLEVVPSESSAAVESLHCATVSGSRFEVRGRHYVIAAGGLETARLLLASRKRDPRGVGNRHDLVGRYYMCHIESSVGELVLSPASRGVSWGFERTSDGVYGRRKFQVRPEEQRRRRLLNSMVRLHHAAVADPSHGNGVLSLMYLVKGFIIPEFRRKLAAIDLAAAQSVPRGPAHYLAHLRNLVMTSPDVLRFSTGWVVKRHFHYRRIPYVALPSANGRYVLDVNSEQVPNPDSRVTLGHDRDSLGVQRLAIDWRMSEQDVASIVETLETVSADLEASGVGTIAFDRDRARDLVRGSVAVGGHHIGTARMADDPTRGVVDANCRVHGVDNLYIAGSAVFPTCGHANPTLTLVALALRLADHLAARASAPVARSSAAA